MHPFPAAKIMKDDNLSMNQLETHYLRLDKAIIVKLFFTSKPFHLRVKKFNVKI